MDQRAQEIEKSGKVWYCKPGRPRWDNWVEIPGSRGRDEGARAGTLNLWAPIGKCLDFNIELTSSEVFVIDDSKSMRPYWDHCVNTFRVLSYVVKQADPRGIELCFSSSPDNWTRYKDTTPAVNAIKKRRDHIYQDDRAISDDVALSSLVEISTDDRLERHRLEAAVQRIMERKSGSGSSARKRTSVDIFIFTDGKWETKAPALTTIECPEFVRCLHVVRFGSPLVTQLSTTASNLQTLVRNQFQDGSQENTQ